MKRYNFKEIEKKWQIIWGRKYKSLWKAADFSKKTKKYILDMFPYPSGEGLHVGHVEGYTATDILSRFYRMRGYNVLHPMGWDAFGLPAENYAIRMKKNPNDFVPKNILRFKKQMTSLGLSYDWDREINTTSPDYYKWTQWIFLKMYEKGLVYQKEAPINFCPSCKTGLADEEVINGKCERCGSSTQIKNLNQWHLRITLYAERLLKDLDQIDWPENIKEMQRNWIGKSEGYELLFPLENKSFKIPVFTTRLDTVYGVTFVVLSPSNPLSLKIADSDYLVNVENYIRENIEKEKWGIYEKEVDGVFTGSYVLHPLTGKRIPVWVSDYVLSSYGTGAIMGVPAHDERDYKFAKKFDLEILEVIKPLDNSSLFPFEGEGILINSGEHSGLESQQAREVLSNYLTEKGLGKKAVYYKLRDWIFSRQRYWGEPIPLIHCKNCGIVPLKEKDLPLKLPYIKSYQPSGTGESPLKNIKNWVKTKCPRCQQEAERETQTMPQWAGSCWYYLRFIDNKNNKKFADYKKLKYWLPVDFYVGGAEHAVLHLLYARFWHKFLYDLKLVPTSEPFYKLFNQGIILGPDGQKMSKSKGNVINPDEVIKKYGADSLRMFEMFLGPLETEKPWSDEGIRGIFRFLTRVWKLCQNLKNVKKSEVKDKELELSLNDLIFEVTDKIEKLRFNLAISKLMVFENLLTKKIQKEANLYHKKIFLEFIKLLFPFAPHICQEIWHGLGKKTFLDKEKWPVFKKIAQKIDSYQFVVQVNGKKRGFIVFNKSELSEKEVKEKIKETPIYSRFLKGKKILKIVFVKGKLVNFVVE